MLQLNRPLSPQKFLTITRDYQPTSGAETHVYNYRCIAMHNQTRGGFVLLFSNSYWLLLLFFTNVEVP